MPFRGGNGGVPLQKGHGEEVWRMAYNRKHRNIVGKVFQMRHAY